MTATAYKESAKPKRSSDRYVNIRKKITDPVKLKVIEALSKEWCLTKEEVCIRILHEGIARERNRIGM